MKGLIEMWKSFDWFHKMFLSGFITLFLLVILTIISNNVVDEGVVAVVPQSTYGDGKRIDWGEPPSTVTISKGMQIKDKYFRKNTGIILVGAKHKDFVDQSMFVRYLWVDLDDEPPWKLKSNIEDQLDEIFSDAIKATDSTDASLIWFSVQSKIRDQLPEIRVCELSYDYYIILDDGVATKGGARMDLRCLEK